MNSLAALVTAAETLDVLVIRELEDPESVSSCTSLSPKHVRRSVVLRARSVRVPHQLSFVNSVSAGIPAITAAHASIPNSASAHAA